MSSLEVRGPGAAQLPPCWEHMIPLAHTYSPDRSPGSTPRLVLPSSAPALRGLCCRALVCGCCALPCVTARWLPGLVGQPCQGFSLALFKGGAIGIQCQSSSVHNPSQRATFLNVPPHHNNIITATGLSGTVLHMQSHLIFTATPLAQRQHVG